MADFVEKITSGDIEGTKFGSAAKEYAEHRKGFPDSTFNELQKLDVGKPNQVLLDLGCGTGTLARGFAQRGCKVTGADIDHRMLEEASKLATKEGVEVAWLEASAENTGLPDSAFDAITAGQCWHWFDQVPTITECARLLKPDGKLALCWFDWIPLPDTVPGVTEALIEKHNPEWKLGGIRTRDDYYELFESIFTKHALSISGEFDFIDETMYSRLSWRKRIQASAGIVALDSDKAQAFDEELDKTLIEEFGTGDLHTPHRVVSFVLAKK